MNHEATLAATTILLIEDEPSVTAFVRAALERRGYAVVPAASGAEGLARLEEASFGGVISDIRMPGASGVDLLKFTKEVAPSTVFILITGVPTVDTAISALNAGAKGYLLKDSAEDDVVRAILLPLLEGVVVGEFEVVVRGLIILHRMHRAEVVLAWPDLAKRAQRETIFVQCNTLGERMKSAELIDIHDEFLVRHCKPGFEPAGRVQHEVGATEECRP